VSLSYDTRIYIEALSNCSDDAQEELQEHREETVCVGTNRTHWFGHSVSRNKFVRVSCKKCGERAPTTLHPALCGICLIARWRRRGEFQ